MCVKDVLLDFCIMSSQEVSVKKTSIYFSKNVDNNMRRCIVDLSGFNETFILEIIWESLLQGELLRGLIINISLTRLSLSCLVGNPINFLLMEEWFFSKYVREAIPIYPMMTSVLPDSRIQEIQKIRRSFIWGDNDQRKKVHLLSWDKLILPKGLGGLGLRNLENMNNACLLKLGWAIRNGNDGLWTKVLRGK